jgi:hypothetical protein
MPAFPQNGYTEFGILNLYGVAAAEFHTFERTFKKSQQFIVAIIRTSRKLPDCDGVPHLAEKSTTVLLFVNALE